MQIAYKYRIQNAVIARHILSTTLNSVSNVWWTGGGGGGGVSFSYCGGGRRKEVVSSKMAEGTGNTTTWG